MTERRVVEIERGPAGLWGWTYREGDFLLRSNESYESRGEAEMAARTAYPQVERRSRRGRGPNPSRPRGVWGFVLMLVVLWRWTHAPAGA